MFDFARIKSILEKVENSRQIENEKLKKVMSIVDPNVSGADVYEKIFNHVADANKTVNTLMKLLDGQKKEIEDLRSKLKISDEKNLSLVPPVSKIMHESKVDAYCMIGGFRDVVNAMQKEILCGMYRPVFIHSSKNVEISGVVADGKLGGENIEFNKILGMKHSSLLIFSFDYDYPVVSGKEVSNVKISNDVKFINYGNDDSQKYPLTVCHVNNVNKNVDFVRDIVIFSKVVQFINNEINPVTLTEMKKSLLNVLNETGLLSELNKFGFNPDSIKVKSINVNLDGAYKTFSDATPTVLWDHLKKIYSVRNPFISMIGIFNLDHSPGMMTKIMKEFK